MNLINPFRFGAAPALGTPVVTAQTLGTPRGAVTGDFNGRVGFQASTGGATATMYGLARWVFAGNSGTHIVYLYDVATVTVLGQVSVNCSGAPTGAYKRVDFGSPVSIAAGTAYAIVSQEVLGGDQWYDDDTVPTFDTYWNNSTISAGIDDLAPGSFFTHTIGHCYGPVNGYFA